jgi:adenylate cyclase class IV
MARNIESKARCNDLAALAAILRSHRIVYDGVLVQRDTYFAVESGRLKLRELTYRPASGGASVGAELIRYERPDESGARVSEYECMPVAEPRRRLRELAAQYGVRSVVTKRRELWLSGATRIHLDDVDGLGTFVELETVLGGQLDEGAQAEHLRLRRLLGLDQMQPVESSYGDLAEAAG